MTDASAKVGVDVYLACGLVLLLAVIGTVIGDTMVGVLLAPFAFALMVYCMARVPLRVSLMTMIFLTFTMENPGDAESQWEGPFHTVCAMMNTHLNTIDRSVGFTSWMSFSGMDLCLFALFIIARLRKASGSKMDSAGRVPTPKPLVQFGTLTVAGIAFTWISGMLRGGIFGMSLWQLDRVMYFPAVFFLSHMALRGPKDLPALAKVVLVSAAYKACIAIYVASTVQVAPDPETGSTRIACATNHADSILFAVAVVLVIALVLERVRGSAKWIGLALLPLICGGIVANNRRMAWVEVGAVCLVVYMVARDNAVKRRIRRTLTFLSPAIVGYLVVGWDSTASAFKPVQMVRSVVDPQTDGSTLWREIENYDIITTLQMHPFFGTGFGNGYIEFFPLPQIPYALEHYAPHNSILGMWCYAGIVGYFAMTSLWVGGIYFGMRAYHAALVSFGSIVIYMAQCWGDMGLGTSVGVYMVAPCIAIAGKLLVVSGDWSSRKSARKFEAAPQGPVPQADPRAA